MLPWDVWGECWRPTRGRRATLDKLLDEVADACDSDNLAAVAALYTHEVLRVPPELVC